MSNKLIHWFSSSNVGAPLLTNTWGCLIDLLDACLVNGFGSQSVSQLTVTDGVAVLDFGSVHNLKQFQVIEISGADDLDLNGVFKIFGVTADKVEITVNAADQVATGTITCKLAPLNWTKVFSGMQKAVYQAKNRDVNPFFLRVDNSCDQLYGATYAKFAKVGILVTCSDIDDISGVQAPYEPSEPTRNWVGTGSGATVKAGWLKWQYATHEKTASATNFFESEGAANGDRSWVLIGTEDCFYLVTKTTVTEIHEVPYGFGSIVHDGKQKPFLFGVNRYAAANSNTLAATSLGNPSRSDVAALYDYAGNLANDKMFSLVGAFNNTPSGIGINQIKIDPVRGYILTPLYLMDNQNYIIDELPLVRTCLNNASNVGNHSLFIDEDKVYIACRYRTEAGGVLGSLFFNIYDGA